MENKVNLITIIGGTFLALMLIFTGCHKQQNKSNKNARIVTAKLETPVSQLSYAGVLQPIMTNTVTSPVDGRVDEVGFFYGENITKGQVLVKINSTALSDEYQQAVSDYLQKKETYINGIASFDASKALYKADVMSREAFTNDRTQFENNVLAFFQAKFKLEAILKKVQIDPTRIENLSLSNIGQVNKILAKRFTHVNVYAPSSGVALFPLPDQGGGSDNKQSGKLTIGSELKTGQLMLSIGDLSGLSTEVQVSELNVIRLKKGMPVTVSGDAFAGITLNGFISSVASQANPDQGGGGGGLSIFNVGVKIPKVTQAELKAIRVGMTAKVQIDIKGRSQVILPVKAVFLKNNQPTVTVVDSAGKYKDVPVVIGNSTPTSVPIIHGVKAGDKVVIHD